MEYSGLEIKLKLITDVQEFINVCRDTPYDVNIYQRRMVIDGKSVMGIYSLDLSQPIGVELVTVDKEVREEFYSRLDRWRVS